MSLKYLPQENFGDVSQGKDRESGRVADNYADQGDREKT